MFLHQSGAKTISWKELDFYEGFRLKQKSLKKLLRDSFERHLELWSRIVEASNRNKNSRTTWSTISERMMWLHGVFLLEDNDDMET